VTDTREKPKKPTTLAEAREQAAQAQRDVERAEAAIVEAEKEVDRLLLAAFRDSQQPCRDKAVDPTCEAAVKGDPTLCAGKGGSEIPWECEAFSAMAKASAAKDATACAAIADESSRALCTSAISGEPACGDGDERARVVCRALQASQEQCPGGEPACTDYRMLTALLRRDAKACDAIPEAAAKELCRGIVARDAASCTGHGEPPTGCREVIVASEVVPAGAEADAKTLLRLQAANVYSGRASCTVSVTIRAGGAEQLVERELPPLLPDEGLKTFTWEIMPPAGSPVVLATSKCDFSK
jgi:hypothetical protein